MLPSILSLLTAVSAGINLWQFIAALGFPLHQRIGPAVLNQGVTIFKPLKGADDYTLNCLESWFAQDYRGQMQLLFGVADPNDPVCSIVRELLKLYPHRDAELVICEPLLGANAKVSTLTHLQKRAKHEFWIVSDADVFGPEDLITEVMAKLNHENVGLVNCFYKLRAPETFGMLWECVAINADFWSQVCQSNTIRPMNFALGAVMAVKREAALGIGGFEVLLNQLADDYQLGRQVADAGWTINLSAVPVECREEAKGFVETWKHQLRWARTIRVCQPAPYFASILANLTLFAFLEACLSGNWLSFSGWVSARSGMAAITSHKMTRRWDGFVEAFVFAPLKDFLQCAIWLAAFVGSTVIWRNQKYLVKRGGDLESIS